MHEMDSMPNGFPLEPKDADGNGLSVGDGVCIRSVESCIAGLPEEDRERLLALVGKTRTIVQFDRLGFLWLSFEASGRSADFCLFPREVRHVRIGHASSVTGPGRSSRPRQRTSGVGVGSRNMTNVRRSDNVGHTPAAQLRALIERFDPKDRKLVRAVRTALRSRFPTANELAYDYGTSVVISYSPTQRGIDAVVSLALRPAAVALYFNQGLQLPDPKRLLHGAGRQARFIPLTSAGDLARAGVRSLIAAALDRAKIPLPSEGKGRLVIKKQDKRSRRAPDQRLGRRRAVHPIARAR